MNKILLIGCGHMGEALLKAWLLHTNYKFIVVDPIKYKDIKKNFGNEVVSLKSIDNIKDINLIDSVIFAVKPQILSKVLSDFQNYKFKKNTIYISIVAGKKINFFNKFLPLSNQFIRVMPNMPALINESMSCLLSNKYVTKKNINFVNILFSKVGKTIWLKDEVEINKVTAISGSGPGYIFFIIDAFEKAAKELGMNNNITKELVHQTLFGSINLFLNEKKSAATLAKNIAIKGGTTEAGLNVFRKNKVLHETFKNVIKAAYLKSNQLGK